MNKKLIEAVKSTNPLEDCDEILQQFQQNNEGEPARLVEAVIEWICKGLLVLFLDEKRLLRARWRNDATSELFKEHVMKVL